MDEKANTPSIRFAGFTNTWEKRKLAEAFLFEVSNNTLSRAALNYEEGEVKSVHYGDILIKYGAYIDTYQDDIPYITGGKSQDYTMQLLREGDIIFADTAEDETAGKVSEIVRLNGDSVVSGLHTIVCRPLEKKAPYYLGYYLNSDSYHRQLLPLMQGIKVLSLSRSNLVKTFIHYPQEEKEQAEIGTFFRALDNLITLHQNKHDKLVNIKKSMLEKMFPQHGADVPEIRFAGFTDAWKQNKLKDIVALFQDPVPTPHEGYWRLGIRSHAKGTFHNFVLPGKELETAQMHKVSADKLIVNITFAWEHAVAITDGNDAEKLVSHRFPQFSFCADIDPKFFKYIILDEKFRYCLWLASPGSAGRNRVLKIQEMLKYEVKIPIRKEQEKIAFFFEHLDTHITLHQHKLTKLKNIKKSCLEKMFV